MLLGLLSVWEESSTFRCSCTVRCISVQTLRKNGKKTLSVRASQPLLFIPFLLLKVGREDKDGCALARGPAGGWREELNPGLICSARTESWSTRMSKAVISFSSWLSKRTASLETRGVSCDLMTFRSQHQPPGTWKGPLDMAGCSGARCPLLFSTRSCGPVGSVEMKDGSAGTPVPLCPAWAQHVYLHPSMPCC